MNTIFDHALLELTLCESSLAHLIREAEAEQESALGIFDRALAAIPFGGSPEAYEVAGIKKRNVSALLLHLKTLARAVTQKRVLVEATAAEIAKYF
ncbi:hypothetical protein J2857_006151 [Neorhizobium galegae]|uniref:hypothetical protein n=1 Tax=Neorhizobium galegae TaxID=399 RepID=UPI001AE0ECE6|nr:hypothetical protein [Neorhizobium galegae]MBP2563352.1 hypothetical protein [Neorhizobium galegae]